MDPEVSLVETILDYVAAGELNASKVSSGKTLQIFEFTNFKGLSYPQQFSVTKLTFSVLQQWELSLLGSEFLVHRPSYHCR